MLGNALFLLGTVTGLFWTAWLAMQSEKSSKVFLAVFFLFHVVDVFLNNENAPIVQMFGFGISWWDLFGGYLVSVLIVRFLRGGFRAYYRERGVPLFLWYMLAEMAIIIVSVAEFGPRTLSTYRMSFYFFPFFLVVSSFAVREKALSEVYRLIGFMAVFAIITFFARALGLMELFRHYAESRAPWAEIRYLSNVQTLFLLLYVVVFLQDNDAIPFPKVLARSLGYVSMILILLSTQRMIVLLLAACLLYSLWRHWATSSYRYALLGVAVALMMAFLPREFTDRLALAATDAIEGLETSNVGSRLQDTGVTVQMVVGQGNHWFGELIKPTMFERTIRPGVTIDYVVHNAFVLSFVRGGLFLVVPMLFFWLMTAFGLLRRTLSVESLEAEHIALLFVVTVLLFNNTSGIGLFNAIAIGFAVLVLNLKERSHAARSVDIPHGVGP